MELINDTSSKSHVRLDNLEARFEVAFGDFETRLETDRTEHKMTLMQVKRDLDGQFAQFSGLSSSPHLPSAYTSETESHAQQEWKELLIAFGAVRSDFEALQGEQSKNSLDIEALG